MKVQRFEGLPSVNQGFRAFSNTNYQNNPVNQTKKYEMDSIDSALETDSLDDPILPQIIRKFKKAYNIAFPAKVVEEAKNIRSQIDEYVDGAGFSAVA